MMGALDREGMYFPPPTLPAHRGQTSHGFLSLSFLIHTMGPQRHWELLWLLNWAVLGDPPSPHPGQAGAVRCRQAGAAADSVPKVRAGGASRSALPPGRPAQLRDFGPSWPARDRSRHGWAWAGLPAPPRWGN